MANVMQVQNMSDIRNGVVTLTIDPKELGIEDGKVINDEDIKKFYGKEESRKGRRDKNV